MAKGSRGGRRATTTQTISTTPTPSVSTGTRSYGTMTDTMAQQLRDDVDDNYTSDVVDAIKLYISKKTDSAGYSYSQNLNYKLDNDMKLNTNEKFIDKNMQQGMHDLGNDVVLTRACHDDVLKSLGIQDYSKLTEQQLQSKLVGGTITSKAYMSFSYDESKNPFLTGSQSGGREVIWKVNAGKNTKVVFGAKSQAEIITNKGTQYKITNVKYTNKMATPRNSATSKPVVIIEAEVV